MKKIPQRMCVVTREKHDKRDLLRVVKNKEGKIFIDESGKANGRGAYITKSIEVLELAKNKKVLERVFECDNLESLYEDIKNYIK